MNERIIELRKSLKKSQAKFAEEIGLSVTFINLVENGNRNLSDRTISDICRIYNVNEEWLKNGTGEMYKPRSDNEIIAKFVNDVMESRSDDFRKRLINALSQLDEDEWKVLEEIAKKMQ